MCLPGPCGRAGFTAPPPPLPAGMRTNHLLGPTPLSYMRFAPTHLCPQVCGGDSAAAVAQSLATAVANATARAFASTSATVTVKGACVRACLHAGCLCGG